MMVIILGHHINFVPPYFFIVNLFDYHHFVSSYILCLTKKFRIIIINLRITF